MFASTVKYQLLFASSTCSFSNQASSAVPGTSYVGMYPGFYSQL